MKDGAQVVSSIFSFCAGVGLMDTAFEDAGFEISFVNELDDVFMRGYKFAREQKGANDPRYGFSDVSIQQLLDGDDGGLGASLQKERELGHSIGFIGGPPCPDFSIAGKNKGFEGENGCLTRTYFDLVVKHQPDYFVFENVRGLVRTAKHRAFYNDQKEMLGMAGYLLSDRLLNSLEFGVPQSRTRIFLIGIRGKSIKSWLSELPDALKDHEMDVLLNWSAYKKFDISDVVNARWPTTHEFRADCERRYVYAPNMRELTPQYWFKLNDVANHPNGSDQFKVRKGKNKIETIREGDVSGKSFKRLHRHRYSPTAAYGNNEVHLHPYKARRISVAEAMAIQSLPKDFALPSDMPISKKFKAVGNGVPYLMAHSIALSLKDALEKAKIWK